MVSPSNYGQQQVQKSQLYRTGLTGLCVTQMRERQCQSIISTSTCTPYCFYALPSQLIETKAVRVWPSQHAGFELLAVLSWDQGQARYLAGSILPKFLRGLRHRLLAAMWRHVLGRGAPAAVGAAATGAPPTAHARAQNSSRWALSKGRVPILPFEHKPALSRAKGHLIFPGMSCSVLRHQILSF